MPVRWCLAVFLCVSVPLCAGNLAEQLAQLESLLSPPPKEVLQAYLHEIARKQLARRRARVAAIRTPQQFQQRRAEIRGTILDLIGGLPAKRTPLNLRRVGTLDRGNYRVEKIIYESLPNYHVTANLYIPKFGTTPYPAVFYALGHGQAGKSFDAYQLLSIGLVKRGFVVLTIDPIGQGERRIFYDERIQTSLVGKGSMEHQMVGVQTLLGDEELARYFIWDGMRGIDLLESVPEVDSERIGITGCSGGGMLTAYLAALDQRLKVAAPACYISAWEEQLEGTGPQDAEQHFVDQLAAGINHADYVIAFAPRPYLICAMEEDFFPIEGTRRSFLESRRIYSLLGAKDRIDLNVAPGPHGVREPTRKVIYEWLTRWLKGKRPRRDIGPPPIVEYEETLNATSTGQVTSSLGSETPSSWNIKRFSKIRPPRPKLRSAEDVDHMRNRVRREMMMLTRYRPSQAPLNVRSFGTAVRDGCQIEQLTYDADEGRYVPALLLRPDPARSRKAAVIYVDQKGKLSGLEEGGAAGELAKLGYTVLAIDLAGTGETESDWGRPGQWTSSNQDTTWLALMVGRTMVGLRMSDILRGIDVLCEKELLYDNQILGFGKGFVAVSLLHAAAIDCRMSEVIIEESIVSYRAIAESPIHRRVFDVVVPNVLGRYDLPDLVAAIAPRPVWLVNLRSPLRQPVLLKKVESHYEYAKRAYHAVGAEAKLRIGLRRSQDTTADAYPGLK